MRGAIPDMTAESETYVALQVHMAHPSIATSSVLAHSSIHEPIHHMSIRGPRETQDCRNCNLCVPRTISSKSS